MPGQNILCNIASIICHWHPGSLIGILSNTLWVRRLLFRLLPRGIKIVADKSKQPSKAPYGFEDQSLITLATDLRTVLCYNMDKLETPKFMENKYTREYKEFLNIPESERLAYNKRICKVPMDNTDLELPPCNPSYF